MPSEEDERSYDVPLSREEKRPSYPTGPVCIYEPYIDLFLEPTAAQAREYDVILNVASEVLNPFTGQTGAEVPSKSLHTVAEELRNNVPARATLPGEPEYIHIPWEHNTDIVPDLYEVVKVVDDRVQQKKRVLVHCQCGVSRSASLVVAYGIYKNPAMPVQEAYDYVKARSEWIGPNMNLIMQLQEFRSGLIKNSFNSGSTRSASRVLHSRVPTQHSSTTDAASEPQIPQTAPLPQSSSKHLPPPIATSTMNKILPGPSSAPSGMRWPSDPAPPLPRPQSLSSDSSATPTMEGSRHDNSSMRFVEQLIQKNTARSSSPHRRVVPLAPINVEFPLTAQSSQPLETPRGQEFAMTSTKPSDLDETFGITSPRVDMFPSVLKTSEELPEESLRAEVFAMAPVVPPEIDDTLTLGLTSPRTEGFFELPHRFTTSPPRPKMHRPVALQPTQSQLDAHAVAACGFSHSQAANDAHAAPAPSMRPAQSATAAQASQAPSALATVDEIPDSIRQAREEVDFSDALMSPRAVEFTSNPMHNAMAAASVANEKGKGRASEVSDPRSPPVKGANPITRDIFDVL